MILSGAIMHVIYNVASLGKHHRVERTPDTVLYARLYYYNAIQKQH